MKLNILKKKTEPMSAVSAAVFVKVKRKFRINIFRRRLYSGSVWGDIVIFIFLALLAVFMLFPIYLAIVRSLKPVDEFFVFPPSLLPKRFTLRNFKELSGIVSNMWIPFSRYVYNSIFISVVITVSQLLVSGTAAFALAKVKFPGSRFLNRLVEISLLFSGASISVMTYMVVNRLHLANSYLALTLPFIATPLGLFFMRQFMGQVSDSLIEAARIDGADNLRICWQIVMPNVKPAWITLMIFAFQSAWQIDGFQYVNIEALRPVPAVMQQLQISDLTNAGVAAAAVVVTMLPPMIMFIFFQSNVLETMSHSGLRE